jgi:hypothetical protein
LAFYSKTNVKLKKPIFFAEKLKKITTSVPGAKLVLVRSRPLEGLRDQVAAHTFEAANPYHEFIAFQRLRKRKTEGEWVILPVHVKRAINVKFH